MDPPPSYAQEYGKQPPHYNPNTGPNPAVHQAPQPGWNSAQPPPPPSYFVENERQQAGRSGATVIAVTTTPAYTTQQQVLVLGNCPSCRVGFLRDEFSICGIVMAILFFPIGILCCLCMMDKRCSHCGARF